jgi:phage gpG-like protein
MSISIIKDKVAAVLLSLKDIGAKRVYVGIPSSGNTRQGIPIGNASLGYIHENGSPANNIPARPFLKVGVAAAKAQIAAILKSAAKKSADGDKSAVDKGLNAVGLTAQASIKKTIKAGEGFVPLAVSTIAARKRKGVQGTKPLIRTGQLLNSINYVVRDK